MKGSHLGEFEELVLLAVGILGDRAYAISVSEEIASQTNRTVSISPVHTALYRLEKKGFVTSKLAGATAVRGGRRKRMYEMTPTGRAAVDQVRTLRNRMWDLLPDYEV